MTTYATTVRGRGAAPRRRRPRRPRAPWAARAFVGSACCMLGLVLGNVVARRAMLRGAFRA